MVLLLLVGYVLQKEFGSFLRCEFLQGAIEKDSCRAENVISEMLAFNECIRNNENHEVCRNQGVKDALMNSCIRIVEQNTRDLCYTTLVYMYNDFDLCTEITDQSIKDKCFLYWIDKLADCKSTLFPCRLEKTAVDVGYCGNFSTPGLQQLCTAVITENRTLCYQITSTSLKNQCWSSLGGRADSFYNYKQYKIQLMPWMLPAMEWIEKNTPQDAVIVTWWDYGHMIQALGQRNTIIFTPSEEILSTVGGLWKSFYPPLGLPILTSPQSSTDNIYKNRPWDSENLGPLSNHHDVNTVARILTTTDPAEARLLMEQYNAGYVLATHFDVGKAIHFYNLTSIPTELVQEANAYVNQKSLFYRMLQNETIDGFSQVYVDQWMVIYQKT